MSIEAMKQALEALLDSIDDVRDCLNQALPNAGYARYDQRIEAYRDQLAKHEKAIADLTTALRRELEKPAAPDDELMQALIERDETQAIADELAAKISEITGDDIGEHTSGNCPWRKALEIADDWINRPQPARELVGLTDEEMHKCWDSPLTPLGMKHARMIEAKLREKNGGGQ